MMKVPLAVSCRQMTSITLLSCALSLALDTSASASFVSFDFPGADTTTGVSINSSGVVVGYAETSSRIASMRAPGGIITKTAFVRTPEGIITQISVPDKQSALANAINDNGTIAGWAYNVSDGVGFVRAPDGSITVFNGPEGSVSSVSRINEKDAVLGQSGAAFVRASDGTYTTIEIKLRKKSFAGWGTDIDDNGVVTGYFHKRVHDDGALRNRAPKWKLASIGFVRDSDGTLATFQGPKMSITTLPCCINKKGWIVGTYYDPETGHPLGFLRTPDGHLQTINAGGYSTDIFGINDRGFIVGVGIHDGGPKGFVRYPNGKMKYFVAQEGCRDTVPVSINIRGEITGYYIDASGHIHGFVGTP